MRSKVNIRIYIAWKMETPDNDLYFSMSFEHEQHMAFRLRKYQFRRHSVEHPSDKPVELQL